MYLHIGRALCLFIILNFSFFYCSKSVFIKLGENMLLKTKSEKSEHQSSRIKTACQQIVNHICAVTR